MFFLAAEFPAITRVKSLIPWSDREYARPRSSREAPCPISSTSIALKLTSTPANCVTDGIVHALRAIEIDNTLAETYALIGNFRQLDSNAPRVRMRYAVSELMPHGRLDVAIFELERALELDPFSMRAWKGIILVLSRRFEEALLKPTG